MRYALRVFAKTPGFTAVAILTLALGIGANTAVFSVVDALLLRPLPVQRPERLMVITASRQKRSLTGIPVSLILYEQLRHEARSYSGVAAYTSEGFTLTGAGEPEELAGGRVSANFFDVLGVRPALGRGFSESEGMAGGPRAAVLSDKLWRQRFGGDPAIVGKPIELGGAAFTAVGVLPAEFQFPAVGADVWVSKLDEFQGVRLEQIQHGAGYLFVLGRLRDSAAQSAASAEAAVMAHQYTAAHPGFADAEPGMQLDLVDLRETFVSGLRRALLVLMAAVGCVLIIACANVASLTMARATGRQKEMALRAALGAGRVVLLRQLLVESACLAAAGALAGVALAELCLSLAGKALADFAPGFAGVGVDARVLAFTTVVSIVTAAGFGLWPAWRSSRPDLMGILRDSGRGNSASAGRRRARNLLVVGQAAVSVALLIGAGLLIQSFRKVAAIEPGFNPGHALTLRANLPGEKYPEPLRAQFARSVVERLSVLPGVQSASVGTGLPLTGVTVMAMFLAQGQPSIPIAQRPLARWVAAAPGYFHSLGIPLVAGREFAPEDDGNAQKMAMVSQNLAKRYWPDQNPVGKHIIFTRRELDYEVVGVAADVKTDALDADSRPTMYTEYAQYPGLNLWFTVRTAGDPNGIARAAAAQVAAVDHSQPVTDVETLTELVATTLAQRRQVAYLISGFGAIALALAIIGLYGVLSYSVAQRTTEIGVRQAIGAGRGDILRMVLAQGLGLSLAGVAVGAVAGVFVTKPLAGMLYGVTSTDPYVYGAIALVFAAMGAAASVAPAWRATRIDPVEALR